MCVQEDINPLKKLFKEFQRNNFHLFIMKNDKY